MTDGKTEGWGKASRLLLLPLCACVWWSGGCFTGRRPVVHDAQWYAPHAAVIPASTAVRLDAPPDISPEIAAMPPALAVTHAGPAKPRVVPQPAAEPAPAAKKAEPSIAPELSSGELAAARLSSNRSLGVAEGNLARTQGKTLNAAQQDLASKVREFMESAREAMKSNDWSRAMNLAKKAEVLSEGLAGM